MTTQLERRVSSALAKTTDEFDRQMVSEAQDVFAASKPSAKPWRWERPRFVGAAISHRWWMKISAAAAIVLALALVLYTGADRSGMAYALEQTVEATRHTRSVHVKTLSPPSEIVEECWVQFDDAGTLAKARFESGSGEDLRITVCNGEFDKTYYPARKTMQIEDTWPETKLIRRDDRPDLWDPGALVDDVAKKIASHEYKASTTGASDSTEAITLTASSADYKIVLTVDPKSRLATEYRGYSMADGKERLIHHRQFLDYDKDFGQDMFSISAAADTVVHDLTHCGLDLGDLPDEQAAVELVRQYCDAMVAKDYEKMITLSGSSQTPAELKKWVEDELGLVYTGFELGKAEADVASGKRSYQVPYTLKYEIGGKQESSPKRKVSVRPTTANPKKWIVRGGI